MANDFFQFKEFTIHQARSAMRVTTDACILGAWVAKHFSNHNHVLDIGSGTGLLLLMMAQQMPVRFTGVELNEDAYHESLSNIAGSEWEHRIKVIHEDIRRHNSAKSYDLIVSNPPFYEHDLKRPNAAQNQAMHGSALTLQELVDVVDKLINQDGEAIFLLPPHRMELFANLMQQAGLFEKKTLAVKHSRNHATLRSISVFSRSVSDKKGMETLIIREPDGSYTDEFRGLMKPYYLFM